MLFVVDCRFLFVVCGLLFVAVHCFLAPFVCVRVSCLVCLLFVGCGLYVVVVCCCLLLFAVCCERFVGLLCVVSWFVVLC